MPGVPATVHAMTARRVLASLVGRTLECAACRPQLGSQLYGHTTRCDKKKRARCCGACTVHQRTDSQQADPATATGRIMPASWNPAAVTAAAAAALAVFAFGAAVETAAVAWWRNQDV